MNATKNIRRFQLCVVLSIAMSYGLPGISEGEETCPTNSSGPDICVAKNGAAPVEGIDFTVNYTTDPAKPSVALKTGALSWNVRSVDAGSPGNIGTLSLDPTVPADDFIVTIKNPLAAGAVNVGTINLDAAGFTGFSSIGGGSISGNLTGGLTVVQDSGGAGGEVTFAIDGNVSGAVTIPVVNDFEIGGILVADLSVTETITDSLVVFGSVASTVTVTINNFTGGGDAFFMPLGSHSEFAGDLILSNGVPANTNVKIGGGGAAILSTTQIDLKGKAVVGSLMLRAPNAGTIMNGGAVSGTVELASGVANDFTGTASFASVSSTGLVFTGAGADLTGHLDIKVDMAGEIKTVWATTGGDVSGDIDIGEDVTGNFNVDGVLSGDIVISGTLSGDLRIDDALAYPGRVLVENLFTGLIRVGDGTADQTLIHLKGGLGSGGVVELNADEGNFNAVGDIHVGPVTFFGPPPPPITFDGCIRIHDEAGTGNGGDLAVGGEIKVVGCHATNDNLNICVDGAINGNITLHQPDCTNQVVHSCGTCP